MRKSSISSIVCLNCGKNGHNAKNCRYPVNSYGCIIFKNTPENIPKFLMIQKKYTPEYIELLRGRYYDEGELNYQYLLLLIIDLPLTERNYIESYDFDYLWKNIWQWIGSNEQLCRVTTEYELCRNRFNLLKNGHMFNKFGHLSFDLLFKGHPTKVIEPDWELPKGKRRLNETDQQCSVRETCEETALNPEDFYIYPYIKPFQEKFTGVNGIRYCNNYYVACLVNMDKNIYYDPSHREQNTEIRKIGWFSENEIYQLINPHNSHKFKLVCNVNMLTMNLLKDHNTLVSPIEKDIH